MKMKMKRILSLLLVVVFILLSFSTVIVFAEEDEETVSVPTDTETPEEAGEETGDEAAQPHLSDDGVLVYPKEALTQVDPTDEANTLIMKAADAVAEGRAVTVYAVPLVQKIAIQSGTDYVGLCTYADDAMTFAEPYYTGEYTYYDLGDGLGEDEIGYVLTVANISESDIARLPEMDAPTRLEWKINSRGLFESPQQRVRAMTNYYEDDKTILYADDELAEIAVYNKTTDQYYFSSPYNYRRVAGVTSAAAKSRLASLAEINYYDNAANLRTVYSYTDAVEKTEYADENDEDSFDNIQFTSEKIDNGVRFHLNIGTQKVDTLLPYAAEALNFETKVLAPVQAMADSGDANAERAMRKFKAYYTRYSYAELSASMQRSLIAHYPGLKDHDLYILREVKNREKQFLSEYVKLSKMYTWTDYYNDLDISGYVPEENAVVCFEIQVDFTIENGELVVDMPTDAISYDRENFTMASVSLLRYFGCGMYSDDGFTFVPDGSGCVIKFNSDNTKTETALTRRVYGDDYSLTTTKQYYNLSQTAYLPVYGLKDNDQGFLAIIEKGAAMATVQNETGNKQSAFETAFATFVYNTVQQITYSDGSKENGSYTYFNQNSYTGGYKLRFKFLTGKDITYVDMAKAYRQYLLDNHLMAAAVDASNKNVPLVLETLGLIDKTASFYGIIYNKKIPMTTFADAQSMLTELTDNGIGNVALRYRGWMNGGLNYSVPSSLSIEGKLGGGSGFKKLTSYMADRGYTLFPEVDFCVVRRDGLFDGYSTTSNAPKMTDRTTVTLTPRNELDNVMEIKKNYFAISPSSASKYFKSFFNKYKKYSLGSVSIGTVGNMLYSDFGKGKKATNRQQAVDFLDQNVEKYVTGSNISRIMVEGGNAYTYAYATDIVDIPLSDSNTFQSDASVPFMQIVLHGHIQYAGTALNVSDDITDTILKSAEYGANLHFTLSAKNTRELKDTVYSNYYTIDFDTWKSDVIELYNKFNTVFASLQTQEISDHAAYAGKSGVYITTYANGTRVAVNYNKEDVTVEGKTIPAQDFAVL